MAEEGNNEHPGAHHNKLLFEWQAPEFINHHKSKTWFMIAGLITIGLIMYALYTKSATMAIVFIVLAGVYYMTHNQDPKIINVKITELGIYLDEKFIPYNMISAFWVVYHPPYVMALNLKLSSSRKMVIQLADQNPVEVRRLLAKEIPEVEGEQESMLDLLIRMLRL